MSSIRLSNFTNDPFAVSTVSFGIIAWIISLAGAAASTQSNFPKYTWWGIFFELALIVAVFLLYLYNNVELYKFTLVGLVSVAFVYSTNSTNALIYNTDRAGNACCAAGNVLLSILNIIWIVYFGGHPELPTNQFVDSFAFRLRLTHAGHNDHVEEEKFPLYQNPSIRANIPVQGPRVSSYANGPYVSSSQLNGLENLSSPEVQIQQFSRESRDLTRKSVVRTQDQLHLPVPFKYTAQALYSYEANPEDANEISFVKDEILEVDDISGKWWHARRATGETGICPSNYVKLLD